MPLNKSESFWGKIDIKLLYVINLACFLLIPATNYADVWLIPESEQWIDISGEIKRGDYDEFVQAIKTVGKNKNRKAQISLNLNSPGGDLLEAMKIGRLVRRLRIGTHVGHMWEISNGEEPVFCGSSCFFILVAGISRRVSDSWKLFSDGRPPELDIPPIGIHRPFFKEEYLSDQSLWKAEKDFKSLETATTKYLKDMGVPINFIEKMYLIKSDNVRLLTKEQFVREIGEKPGYFEEWITAKCGSISDAERKDRQLWWFYEEGLDKTMKLEKMNFSDDYGEYLNDKVKRHGKCYSKLITAEQNKKIDEFLR